MPDRSVPDGSVVPVPGEEVPTTSVPKGSVVSGSSSIVTKCGLVEGPNEPISLKAIGRSISSWPPVGSSSVPDGSVMNQCGCPLSAKNDFLPPSFGHCHFRCPASPQLWHRCGSGQSLAKCPGFEQLKHFWSRLYQCQISSLNPKIHGRKLLSPRPVYYPDLRNVAL